MYNLKNVLLAVNTWHLLCTSTHPIRPINRSSIGSLICSSPLCFSNALGSFVGFSQYTANFYVFIYFLFVTWTTCFGLSYFRPSLGPSFTLLLAMPGVMWLFA